VSTVTINQLRQVRQSDTYDDGLPAGPTLQSGARNLQDDLNALRSQIKRITGEAAWTTGPQTDLATLATNSGLTAAQHAALHQLIHFISEGPAEQYASGALKETLGIPFASSEIWYTDNTKTKRS
jgi:hypothetical protein